MKKIFLPCTVLFIVLGVFAQTSQMQDSMLNNLVHPAGYKTTEPGKPGAVKKYGKGKQAMIVVPGIGFGMDVFGSFIKQYKNKYTIYAVTPAGFDGNGKRR
jgi:hypothetical protein